MTIMHQNQQKNKLFKHALVWLRRDLRIQDHRALSQALIEAEKISFAFIFDITILKDLKSNDRRLTFIWQSLLDIENQLNDLINQYLTLDSSTSPRIKILCMHGNPIDCIPQLADILNIDAVYSHEDYEPIAHQRDFAIQQTLLSKNIAFNQQRDHVLAPHDEIFTQQQKPYTVFSPYKRAVLKYLEEHPENLKVVAINPQALAIQLMQNHEQIKSIEESFEKSLQYSFPHSLNWVDLTKSMMQIGFSMQELVLPAGISGAEKLWHDFQKRLDFYHQSRDFPSIKVIYLCICLLARLAFVNWVNMCMD
jgi:deoxyribodipyrimidine photo-lyase